MNGNDLLLRKEMAYKEPNDRPVLPSCLVAAARSLQARL
jgi:hypothetical protein